MMFTLKTVASLLSRHSHPHRPQGVSSSTRPGAAVPFLLLLALGAITSALLPTPARAQCGDLPQFLPIEGVDRGAQTLALLPNGDVVVNVGGHNSTVLRVEHLARGAGGAPMGAVTRYRPSTNEFFDMGLSMVGPDNGPGAGWVSQVLTLPDGDLIAASAVADMKRRDGTVLGRVARYNAVSGVWSSIASGISGAGPEPSISAYAILPEGDIIFGGDFSDVHGVSASGIIRYNPTGGVWSPIGSGVAGTVRALAVLPSGQLAVGGIFASAGGVSANNVALVNLTTGAWSAVGSGVTGGTGTPTVRALVVLSSGDVAVGGSFATAGGAPAQRIAKFNPTTRIWSSISGVPSGVVGVVALTALPDGGALVSGNLGPGTATVAKVTPAGVWTPFTTTLSSAILAMTVLPGGTEAILAAFGTPLSNEEFGRTLLRIDLNTGAMTTTGPWIDAIGVYPPFDYRSGTWVNAFAEDNAGDVYVGGRFASANGVPTSGLAHLSTKTGAFRSVPGLEPGKLVNALAVLPNGDLIAGGDFNTAGGVPVPNIVRYNPSTGVWSPLGVSLEGSPASFQSWTGLIRALLVLPGGDVLVGGQFERVGGVPCTGLARYHPTTNTWTLIAGAGDPNDGVNCMSFMRDGRVLICGIRHSLFVYDPATGALDAPHRNDFYAGISNDACLETPNGDLAVVTGSYPWVNYLHAGAGLWTRYSDDGVGTTGLNLYSIAWAGGDTPRIFVSGYDNRNRRPHIRAFLPSTGEFVPAAAGMDLSLEFDARAEGHFYKSLALRDGTVMVGGLGVRLLRETSSSGANARKWIPNFTRIYAGAGSTRTVITSNPTQRNASPGETVEFSVAAVGYGQLRYEWLKDGTPIETSANLSAATPTLTLTNVTPADAGAYACRVFNICNVQATSDAVTLSFCIADYNGFGDRGDILDFLDFFQDFGACEAQPVPCGAIANPDLNGDTLIDILDFLEFLDAFGRGC